MAVLNVSLEGFDKLKGSLDRKIRQLPMAMADELNEWANGTSKMAKELCPKDEGHLAGGIIPVYATTKNLKAEVTVAVNYGAFVEFGTKRYAAAYVATLPQEWRDFAGQFKGRSGGTMSEFVQAIMAWVQRKGIGGTRTKSGNVSQSRGSHDSMQQAAYGIALHILRHGIKPHPYLWPASRYYNYVLTQNLKKLFQ